MNSDAFKDIEKLETDLWEAADNLRANSKLTSSDYFMPVLGVIFLRHAANRFEAAHRQAPLVADNPFLLKELRDTDTAGLKRIGDAHLYLRGMQSSVGMKSVPADMVVFDELDEASPDAKSLARERLSHSDYRRLIELSNPSLPGYGIDEAYLESDQRHWTQKCPACGKWTALDKAFPAKLGEEVRVIREREEGTFFRACPSCGAELDLALGEWIADYPGRAVHGYRISQLFSSKVDPGEILREYRKTYNPERFYTLKIGIPWVDVENKLSTHQVLALCGDHGLLERSDRSCTMGVDTGRELHVVVSRRRDPKGVEIKREVVWIGTAQGYEELDSLMERFKVSKCVIDAMPEIHVTREFAKRHGSRVWLCYFNESQKGKAKWDSEQHIVQVNRTEALDAAKKGIRDGEVILPRRIPLLDTFAEHLASDAKQLIEDEETGAKSYRYVRTGTNHYSLAFTYDWLASEKERVPYVPWDYGPAEPPSWGSCCTGCGTTASSGRRDTGRSGDLGRRKKPAERAGVPPSEW